MEQLRGGQMMKKEIFISYASEDKKIVKKICSYIENYGYSCWVSYRKEDLNAGASYMAEITNAIDACKVFLLIASKESIISHNVHNELALANRRDPSRCKIIPIIIDDTLNPAKLNSNIDYVTVNKEHIFWSDEDGRTSLIKTIQNHCTKNLPEKPPRNKLSIFFLSLSCCLIIIELLNNPDSDKQIQETTNTKYKIFISDCTWNEAFEICQKQGGHLLTIETLDELNLILELQQLKTYKNVIFYIGGSRESNNEYFYWNDAEKNHVGTALNSPDSIFKDFWFSNEPSFFYGGYEELYMSLQYDSTLEQWGFNDLYDDIISSTDSHYSSKTGFICEY